MPLHAMNQQNATIDVFHNSSLSSVRPLHGMKAICSYLGKSENTIIKYIREEYLPAKKIGGEWVSDEGLIDTWRLQRIG